MPLPVEVGNAAFRSHPEQPPYGIIRNGVPQRSDRDRPVQVTRYTIRLR